MGGIDLSKPVTNDVLVGDKRNNSVGLWNPDDQVQATNSSGNNGGDSSLTYVPFLPNISSTGISAQVAYDLLAQNVVAKSQDLVKKIREAQKAGNLALAKDLMEQLRTQVNAASLKVFGRIDSGTAVGPDGVNKFYALRGLKGGVSYDSGNVSVYKQDQGGIWDVIGDEMIFRANLNVNVDYDGVFGRTMVSWPTNSISLGVRNPLTFGDKGSKFSLIKQINYTFADYGNLASAGSPLTHNPMGKLDILFDAGKSDNPVNISAYLKNNFKHDDSMPDNVLGINICDKTWNINAEAYNSPRSLLNYGDKIDGNLYLSCVLPEIKGDKGDYVAFILTGGSSQILTYFRQGYDHPPIYLGASITGTWGGFDIVGNLWGVLEGHKVGKGEYDPRVYTPTDGLATWNNISYKVSGGAYQNAKSVDLVMTKDIPNYTGNPVVNIKADDLSYQTRQFTATGTGNGAVTGWTPSDNLPDGCVVIKDIIIKDKAHNRTYMVDINKNIVPMTGNTPADLTSLGMKQYNMTIQNNLLTQLQANGISDGECFFDVHADYGADTTKFDQNALVQLNDDNTVLFDPGASVMDVFNNEVYWTAQIFNGINWPAHNGAADHYQWFPYDPNQAYDMVLNPILAGQKSVAPIHLKISAQY